MTDVSEAEVEAAALASCNTRRELYGSPMIASLDALIPEARVNELLFARAALTAAAQVRGRKTTNELIDDAAKAGAARFAAAAEPDYGPSVLGIPKGEEP